MPEQPAPVLTRQIRRPQPRGTADQRLDADLDIGGSGSPTRRKQARTSASTWSRRLG
jgi:hypothetical protein